MSQDDNMKEAAPLARRGADGLAQIGMSRWNVAHVRFIDGEEGDGPATGGDDADGQDSDAENQDADGEQDSGDGDNDGFDGEFDAKRARTLIDRLRSERDKARTAAAKAAKSAPDAAALQKENLRLKVGLQTGLDADLVDRLRGDTEEELLADAEKLLDRFFPKEKKLEDRTPKPRLRGGSDPDKEPEMSSADVVKAALGR